MSGKVGMQERVSVDNIVAEVTYKAMRRMYLRVRSADGPVLVSAPYRLSRQTVASFVRAHLPWIRRQQQRHRNRESAPPPTYAEGETLWLWGRRYAIERLPREGTRVTLAGDRIQLHLSADAAPAACAAAIEAWYRDRLKDALKPLLAQWAFRLSLPVPRIRIRKMSTRWGSCGLKTRSVCFNIELVRRPPACLEYVVVHELTHFLVPPHNARFYAILDHVLPQWSEVRRELNAYPIGMPG
jgi:predicted metal-dependent hydrolase